MSRANLAVIGLVLATVGCATAPPIMPEPPPPTLAPPPLPGYAGGQTVSEYLAVFDGLLDDIRRYHEFAAPAFANLQRTWDDDVAALRGQLADAPDRTHALRIFDALQNSLLDLHLRFEPAGGDRRWVSLPVELSAERVDGAWSVFVARVDQDAAASVRAGDRVTAIDGVATAQLLAEHRFASSANQQPANMDRVAQSLARRRASLWPELDTTSARVEVARRDTGETATVSLRWEAHTSEPPGLDAGLSMTPACDGVPPRDYGPYTLAAVGARVCIYTSRDKQHAAFPIVRHHSFLYEDPQGGGPRLARLDHQIIADALAKLPRVRGVLLDLRDNHGGNNPHVFLDWYAPAPYDNEQVVVRLHESLAARTDDMLDRMLWSSHRAAQYRQRVARGETTWSHPFLCPDQACTDGERMTPSHPVTQAPIALLVGPWCVSSCDTLAGIFASNRFGPLVGEPTAAAYTVNRMPIDLQLPSGEPLGTFEVAVSRSRFGADGPWIEGTPLPIDAAVPWTWATRDTHDAALVQAAIEQLRDWRRDRPDGRPH